LNLPGSIWLPSHLEQDFSKSILNRRVAGEASPATRQMFRGCNTNLTNYRAQTECFQTKQPGSPPFYGHPTHHNEQRQHASPYSQQTSDARHFRLLT
jgi:hypothetical protein